MLIEAQGLQPDLEFPTIIQIQSVDRPFAIIDRFGRFVGNQQPQISFTTMRIFAPYDQEADQLQGIVEYMYHPFIGLVDDRPAIEAAEFKKFLFIMDGVGVNKGTIPRKSLDIDLPRLGGDRRIKPSGSIPPYVRLAIQSLDE